MTIPTVIFGGVLGEVPSGQMPSTSPDDCEDCRSHVPNKVLWALPLPLDQRACPMGYAGCAPPGYSVPCGPPAVCRPASTPSQL